MNDLLARLAPQSPARVHAVEALLLQPIVASVVASKRRNHPVELLGNSNVWVKADAAALEQALGHVLQNAIDASEREAVVTVRVTQADAETSIVVSDHGCGMDSDFIRNRLFQPFVSTKDGGFGIGTFEARSLILAMGGRIAVESRPGEGTSFTITLPAAQPAVEPVRQCA
jgi:signal transduction histidine kinase